MMTANQQTPETTRASEALASHYHTMIDGWAELSRCCLAAADDMYKTGFDYVKDQVDQLHEIACNPTAAMREETLSKTLNCGFDAADRITQAYLHSLEGVREPLMRVVSAQWPVSRGLAEVMERGMRSGMEAMEKGTDAMQRGVGETLQRGAEAAQRGSEAMEKGTERSEKTMRGAAHAAERGAEEGRHGKRRSA